MSNTIHQHGQGDNFAGDKIQGDKIQGDKIQGDKIQGDKIQGDKIQVDKIQVDKIQVDNFTGDKIQGDKIQNDFFEILELIGKLRQNVAQFPSEKQNEIIIDIDNIEAEIQKPETERNVPNLKNRLLALLNAVSVFGVGIAGITDFTNNVMEIGEKLNFELQLPSLPK